LNHEYNNVLLNANISVDNQKYYLQEINNIVEGEDYVLANMNNSNTNSNTNSEANISSQLNRNSVNDNINLENLQKIDFKKCFYKQPSQMALGREEGNLALSSEIDHGEKSNFFTY
jgi:hypothetical protein